MNSRSEQEIAANEDSVILKPTSLCNAACTFCYASDFFKNTKSVDYLDEKFINYINSHNIKNVILTGGEITCVPNFLKELCDFAKEKDISVSLVSNMIDIIENKPDYWKKFILDNPKLFLTASYQLDNERRDKFGNVIKREDFLNFVNWYNENTKKHLLVISVLNKHNESKILDNLIMAKQYNYTLSIERQIGIGRADSEYLPLDYFKLLSKIIDLDLWENEKHLALFVQCGLYDLHYCNFYCKKLVPVIYINKNDELVETGCDHLSTTIYDYRDYVKTPKLLKECAFCKYCNLCQACHITRKNIINLINTNKIDISSYCTEMKKVFEEFENKINILRGKNGK